MDNLSKFCTCEKLDCKLHPANHNQGCSPCIKKNLGTKEMPSCFFNLIEGGQERQGDTFKDFACAVLKNNEKAN